LHVLGSILFAVSEYDTLPLTVPLPLARTGSKRIQIHYNAEKKFRTHSFLDDLVSGKIGVNDRSTKNALLLHHLCIPCEGSIWIHSDAQNTPDTNLQTAMLKFQTSRPRRNHPRMSTTDPPMSRLVRRTVKEATVYTPSSRLDRRWFI